MSSFRTCSPRELSGNLIQRIAEEWMLVTAGSPEDGVATMTVNWGSMGYLWHKDMAMVVIRHSRNTLPYMERSGCFSLSLFSPEYREQLTFCGRNSGRDVDKIAHCGFTTAYEDGIPYFTQADTVLLCLSLIHIFRPPLASAGKNFTTSRPQSAAFCTSLGLTQPGITRMPLSTQ